MVKITDMRNKNRKFGDIEAGDTFTKMGNLYMKLSGEDLTAVCLEDGTFVYMGYNDVVVPVDIEINIVK